MREDINITMHNLLKNKQTSKATKTELLIISQIAIAQLLGSENHRRPWIGRDL